MQAWWNKQKQLIIRYFSLPFEKKNKPYVAKGDIYLADLGINIGVEIDKTRPVVVFQANRRDVKSLQTIFVFPITSNVSPYRYKVYFEENPDNSKCIKGSIIISQGRSISKVRLKKYWGKLSQKNINNLEKEFLKFIGIQKSPPLIKSKGGVADKE